MGIEDFVQYLFLNFFQIFGRNMKCSDSTGFFRDVVFAIMHIDHFKLIIFHFQKLHKVFQAFAQAHLADNSATEAVRIFSP